MANRRCSSFSLGNMPAAEVWGRVRKPGALGLANAIHRRFLCIFRQGMRTEPSPDNWRHWKNGDYPYDFAVFSWSLWDNTPLDAGVPYAVEEWNKTYAYPKIRICGGHDIMSMIERKYGDRLPTVSGDFTEYWTDGLGTTAALTAMNRNTKELLSQAETVWSMLAKGKKVPYDEFDEAWRYILLASEHTWTFENPFEPFFQNAIWKERQAYFHAAKERAIMAMGEAVAPATDKSNGALGPREGPSKGGISVLNTHTWAHGGIVKLSPVESRLGDRVVSGFGKIMLSQRMANGELWFLADSVPSLRAAHCRLTQGEAPKEGACKIQGNALENEFPKVTLDPKSDNITSRQKQGDACNYIDEKVDGGANSFAWMPANKNLPQVGTVEPITIVEKGPLIAELRIDSKAPGCRSLSRSVRLVAGQPYPWDGVFTFTHWFYKKDNPSMHNARTVIELLCDIVSKNGNMLLNVELKGDGTIPEEHKLILDGVGDWMKINNEAIYAGKPWQIYGDNLNSCKRVKERNILNADVNNVLNNATEENFNARTVSSTPYGHDEVRFITRGDYLYICVLNPQPGKIQLPALGLDSPQHPGNIRQIQLLGAKGTVDFTQTKDHLLLDVPQQLPTPYAAVFKVRGALVNE